MVYQVADFYNLDKSLINPISTASLNQPAKRPLVTGFDISKAKRDLDYNPVDFKEGILIMDQQIKKIMKQKLFSIILTVLMPSLFFAQSSEVSMSNRINAVFEPIVKGMSKVIFYKPFSFIGLDIPLVVLWLVLGAVFFTLFMKFINVKGFFHAIQLVRGKYDDPEDKGEVSHFQALVTALSGTVGLGNIAGVAVAITLGGAGATFWMILAGLLGMSSKFIECTLGVKYREIDENGEVSGGPMYYMSKGLKLKGFKNLGRFLAIIFAILCIGGSFGGGNMFQAKSGLCSAI